MSFMQYDSIKWKLVFISLFTTGVALVLTGAASVAYELFTFRDSLVDNLTAQAKIIGSNSTAALSFRDRKDAAETLSAMKAAPNITRAVIYTKDGKLFAQYRRPDVKGTAAPSEPPDEGYRFSIDRISLCRKISVGRETSGFIFLQSDLKAFYVRFAWKMVATGAIMVLSFFIAFMVLTKLQKTITEPILNLAHLMQVISRERNYSLRAPTASRDELGILAGVFNEMLLQIQSRDTSLNLHRQHLEEQVEERTAELSVAKSRLEKELADRKRTEEELEVKHRQVEELNRHLEERVREEVMKNRRKDHMLIKQGRQAAMGDMIGNIAHQWRQPLNAIGIIVQDLPDAFEHGVLTREYLERSSSRGMEIIQHMSKTIDDFRNFFKPEKEKQQFNLRDVIDKALIFVEASYMNNGIRIEVTEEETITVTGYPNEYMQVLLNILNNAKDALIEKGTSNPLVKIVVSRENNRSVVTITDNAGGVPEDIMDKIFDPYFTTKEEGKGTGIGLYMSKTIIEKNMEGKLSVKNVGQGAEFRVEV